MRQLSLQVLACSALVSAAVAQTYHISPVQSATTEGSSNNIFPWASGARRYQQIHSDMPTTPMRIVSIGFRHNATTSASTGTRTIDMEMSMGRGVGYDQVRLTFDANYVGASKMTVIARKTINMMGGATVSPGPCPFDPNLDVKLDAPYLHLPTDSLLWDVTIYSNTVSGTFQAMDADASSVTSATSTTFGTGCTATGRTSAMSLALAGADNGGVVGLLFTVANAPSTAPVIMIIGTTEIDVPIPGLCSNLYTDLLLLIPFGASSATGALAEALVAPNPGAGSLSAQALSIDVGQTGLPFVVSNRRTVTIPAANTTKVLKVTRLTNTDGNSAATKATLFTTSSIGYGLPTRFTY